MDGIICFQLSLVYEPFFLFTLKKNKIKGLKKTPKNNIK